MTVIWNSVSEMSVFERQREFVQEQNTDEGTLPVISSGKMESRTSRSSTWSSRPMMAVLGVWVERDSDQARSRLAARANVVVVVGLNSEDLGRWWLCCSADGWWGSEKMTAPMEAGHFSMPPRH